jgi:hypothetical protein
MRRRFGRVLSSALVAALTVVATLVPVSGMSTASAARASSSYDVPIDINYHFIWAGYIVGKFVPSASTCATGSDFSHEMKITYEKKDDPRFGRRKTEIIPAAKFAVDTGLGCLHRFAIAAYDISMNDGPSGPTFNGPIRLMVKQVGPRYFVSACSDKFPIVSTCSVVGAPIKPTVILHM